MQTIPIWPENWHNWLQKPEQRKNRSCIIPEIPRVVENDKDKL